MPETIFNLDSWYALIGCPQATGTCQQQSPRLGGTGTGKMTLRNLAQVPWKDYPLSCSVTESLLPSLQSTCHVSPSQTPRRSVSARGALEISRTHMGVKAWQNNFCQGGRDSGAMPGIATWQAGASNQQSNFCWAGREYLEMSVLQPQENAAGGDESGGETGREDSQGFTTEQQIQVEARGSFLHVPSTEEGAGFNCSHSNSRASSTEARMDIGGLARVQEAMPGVGVQTFSGDQRGRGGAGTQKLTPRVTKAKPTDRMQPGQVGPADRIQPGQVKPTERPQPGHAKPPGRKQTKQVKQTKEKGQPSQVNKKQRERLSLPEIPEGFRLPSNAQLARDHPGKEIGRSVGVDLGDKRTGLAVTYKGLAPRPLTVLQHKGLKLVDSILEVGAEEGADEIILGLPRLWDYTANEQTTKTLRFAPLLATEAAKRGCRVYLFDEFNTSKNALAHMIHLGAKRQARTNQLDAYAALDILKSYFESGGGGARLVLPNEPHLREHLKMASAKRAKSKDPDEDDFWDGDGNNHI